jgi:type I site-specific restriction endonuclease
MNEAETRAEHVDPALKAAGWGVVEGSRVRREVPITPGRIEGLGRRGKGLTADYVLEYRNTKMAVIEAKAWNAEGEVEAGKRYEEKDFNKIIESAWRFSFRRSISAKRRWSSARRRSMRLRCATSSTR